MERFKSKIYTDFFWTFVTQVIILLSNFLLNKIFALNLGIESFGVLNIARRGATLMGFIMLSGQGLAIVKFLSYEKSKSSSFILRGYIVSGLKIILSASMIIAILVFVFNKQFAIVFFDNISNKDLLFPMVFFSLSMSLSTYVISVFRGLGKFSLFNFIQIISQLVILLIFLIFKNQTVSEIMIKWGAILLIIPLIIVLYKFYTIKDRNYDKDKAYSKMLLKYGLPRTVGEFIQFSYYLIPLIIVNRKFGGIETSLFSASTGILQLFLPFFSYIGLILLPHTSSAIAQGKFEEVRKKINKGILIYAFMSTFFVIIGIILTPIALRILYSPDFVSATLISRILIMSLIPRSIFLLLRNPIDAISNKPFNTYNLVVSFIIMIILMECMSSPIGVASVFVISDLILCCLSFFVWIKSNKIIEKEVKIDEKI